jgi:5-methylcytosine-specific restriction protein A
LLSEGRLQHHINRCDILENGEPFKDLSLGEQYGRKQLAPLMGYTDWHAIGRGAITPKGANYIVLMLTGKNQPNLPDYNNYFVGDDLHMSGEKGGRADARLENAQEAGDTVYLFFRDSDHQDFTYYGAAHVTAIQRFANRPSRLILRTRRSEAIALNSLETELATHGENDSESTGHSEGRRKSRDQVVYERDAKNRAMAIRIHGTKCKACDFDFDQFYGSELARNYIEVHHAISITSGERVTNPQQTCSLYARTATAWYIANEGKLCRLKNSGD